MLTILIGLLMSLLSFLDAFNVTTGAAGTTYARSGYGFQPKALFVWATKLTGTVDEVSGAIDSGISMGFAVSTSSRCCVANQMEDAAATSSVDKAMRDDAVLAQISNAGAIEALLDISSIDSDGVTFIVDDAFPAAIRVFVLALGGTDLTNVAIGNFMTTNTVATQDVTSVGFQPDALLLLGGATGAALQALNGDACISLGVVDTARNCAVIAGASRDGQGTMATRGYGRSGDAFLGWSVISVDSRASISAWLSNGFTLSYSNQSGVSTRCFYLALKGGQYAVKTGTTQTDTTTDISLSSIGFTPVAGLVGSALRAESTADTVSNHNELSVGAFTGASSERAMAVWDENGTANDESAQAQENDASYVNISSGDAVDGIMHVTSMADPLVFRMADADPSANFFFALLFGSTSAGDISGTSSVTLAMSGSATGTVLVQGAGAVQIALTGSATGQVLVQADSTKAIPVTGSGAGQVLVQAASSQQIPVGGAVQGTVLVQAQSSRTIPVGGVATGNVGSTEISGASSQTIAVGGAAAGTVLVQAESTRSISVGGAAACAVLIQASSIAAIPVTGFATATGPQFPIAFVRTWVHVAGRTTFANVETRRTYAQLSARKTHVLPTQ